ncbi:isopenicillin N synthase family dioxygenase [Spongisporangium articulatum]|uniref:Isopenicillin N synthase family dioxygenase n=1 Tax=Spongisporangium articulatum TaxID=3362603 RepID=A0ABW8AIR2_9ACTN
MSTPDIPLIDISTWRTGTPEQRVELATRLDRAMQDSGFFMVSNHGVSAELMQQIRDASKRFFALPSATKRPYAAKVGGRGWLAKGEEANAFYGEEADADKPDLKESLTVGRPAAELSAGVDPAIVEAWFEPNVFPTEVPELEALVAEYTTATRALYVELLQVLATALGLDEDFFAGRVSNAPYTFNINRYPPLTETETPAEGQFRVGPHTDWGILTILDRQVGYGGLQVQTRDGEWADAPAVPGAFTVNIADMLARWTGDRWRSTRHRVLPPSDQAPDEELISLILFCEADMDTRIEPLPAPIGGGVDYPAITAGDYLLERTLAASTS